MPFKIVQTIEKGRPRLCIVPSIWEEDGKLFWPTEKIKNRARLVRDEASCPSPHWDILDCSVKRNNVQTYMAAEHEIQIMENQTDTDNETPATFNYRLAPEINIFEDMVQNLTHNDNVNTVDPTSQEKMITEETINLIPTLDCDQLIVNQNVLIQKINDQDKILHNIIENIQKLTQKMAMMSVQVSEGLATITDKIDQPGNVVLLKDVNKEENESFRLELINDKQQLEILEITLMDKAERSKLRKQLLFLFQPCEGNGLTFAYKLLDSLISREFLCKCSWSGASRGDNSKIPLKDFKNFIKFFCDMIRSWDSLFTMSQTEKFFKLSLKNAVKRRAMKDLRSSSKRTRKIKPKTQKVPKNDTIHTTPPVPSTSKFPDNHDHDEIDDNIEVDKLVAMEVDKGTEGRKEGEKEIEEKESSDEDLC